MINIKDKLVEIVKKAMADNAYSCEDKDGYTMTYVDDSEWDYTCNAIANKIIAKLPEILADSEWVKLPCKVGDIVYVILYDKVYEAECNYRISKTWVDLAPTLYPTAHTVYNIQDLNEAWFLTQAEAEAKLEELKGATENE